STKPISKNGKAHHPCPTFENLSRHRNHSSVAFLTPADHSLRRRNHTTVRVTHRVGKITPSSTKAPTLPIIWIIQLKFMPKKPVMNVRGRKMIDTSVNRLI